MIDNKKINIYNQRGFIQVATQNLEKIKVGFDFVPSIFRKSQNVNENLYGTVIN